MPFYFCQPPEPDTKTRLTQGEITAALVGRNELRADPGGGGASNKRGLPWSSIRILARELCALVGGRAVPASTRPGDHRRRRHTGHKAALTSVPPEFSTAIGSRPPKWRRGEGQVRWPGCRGQSVAGKTLPFALVGALGFRRPALHRTGARPYTRAVRAGRNSSIADRPAVGSGRRP